MNLIRPGIATKSAANLGRITTQSRSNRSLIRGESPTNPGPNAQPNPEQFMAHTIYTEGGSYATSSSWISKVNLIHEKRFERKDSPNMATKKQLDSNLEIAAEAAEDNTNENLLARIEALETENEALKKQIFGFQEAARVKRDKRRTRRESRKSQERTARELMNRLRLAKLDPGNEDRSIEDLLEDELDDDL